MGMVTCRGRGLEGMSVWAGLDRDGWCWAWLVLGRVGQGEWPSPDVRTHSPPLEYMAHLERQLQFYTEAARRLGNDGSRVSWAGAGIEVGR